MNELTSLRTLRSEVAEPTAEQLAPALAALEARMKNHSAGRHRRQRVSSWALAAGAAVVAGAAISAIVLGVGNVPPPEGPAAAPPAPTVQATPTPLYVADTGIDASPPIRSQGDWSVNVNDPLVLKGFSSAVVSGTVVAVEGSFVDDNGDIATTYSVHVDRVYKGENVPAVIPVALPGGSVPLGEYIAALDRLGLYEMKLGSKSPELLRQADSDPALDEDPREADPTLPVTANWGTNPTSQSLIEQLNPDAWIFYLGATKDGIYYGAAFDHALSYLKNNMVYGLHPETEGPPITEEDLATK